MVFVWLPWDYSWGAYGERRAMSRQSTLGRDSLELLLIASGAIPGAVLRWQTATQLGTWLPGGENGANLLVNALGSVLLGVIVGRPQPRRCLYLVFGVGFCGSFTTFSSWMLAVAQLQQQRPAAAFLLLLLSLGVGLALALVGLQLGRSLHNP